MTQANQFIQRKILGQHLTRFQRQLLENHLETEKISEYRQRIEIMLLADEGHTQTQDTLTIGKSNQSVVLRLLMLSI
jgi:hypothetical protein